MSNLSDLIPAGGGQNNTDFVADGTIVSGKPVILTAAGKVTQVAESSGSETLGGPVEVNDGVTTTPYGIDMCYDSGNDRLVAVYFRSSDTYLMAAVGTISGTTTTWGTPVVVNSAAGDKEPCVDYDPDTGKVLTLYVRASDGNARYNVGTVSGTTSTWGSSGEFYGNNTREGLNLTYDTTHDYFLCTYHSAFGSSDCNVKIGSISGTTVTFGSNYVFTTGASCLIIGIAYDVNADAFAVLYRNNSSQLYGRVGTSTAAKVVTFGSETQIGTWDPSGLGGITYDSTAQKCVAIFRNVSEYGAGAVVTVVGGSTRSFTDGAETAFVSANISGDDFSCHATYAGTSANTTTVFFKEDSDNYPRFCNGTVTGTSIAFNSAARLWTDNALYARGNICPIASGKVGFIAQSSSSTGSLVNHYAYASVLQNVTTTSNLTATNLLGIAAGAISDTATGTINTWGSRNEVQTGLTIGSDYYVQEDGTITTTSTSPAQLIGTAISATQINIKDYTG